LRGLACALILAAVVHRAYDARAAGAARRRGGTHLGDPGVRQQPGLRASVCIGRGERASS
jgi:hypothetical protein